MVKAKELHKETDEDEQESARVLLKMPKELERNLDEWVKKLNEPKKPGEPRWNRTSLMIRIAYVAYETKGIKGEEP